MVTDAAIKLLGRLLEHRGLHYRLVVVGGTALRLKGVITRATEDLDVIAFADQTGARLMPADRPLGHALLSVAALVADEHDLADDWLNSVVSAQWDGPGLPPGMAGRIEWRSFGGLDLGIAGLDDLVALKLYAAVDERVERRTPAKHRHDLIALNPTEAQWNFALAWVLEQDGSPHWPDQVHETLADVRAHSR